MKTSLGIRILRICALIGCIFGTITGAVYFAALYFSQYFEQFYGQNLYPWLAQKMLLISGQVNFSLTDMSYLFAIASLLITPTFILAYVKSHELLRRSGLALYASFGCFGYIASLYFWLWGFNYIRPELADRLKLEATVSPELRVQLLKDAAAQTNDLRANLPENDKGCVQMESDLGTIDPLIDELQDSLLLRLQHPSPRSGKTKVLLFNPIWQRMGTQGIYGFFTGERNITWPSTPGTEPALIAHERAHFAGFASEDAADFIGMLTVWSSPLPLIQYSGWLRFWLLMPTIDRQTYLISPAVYKDMQCVSRFWRQRLGVVSDISSGAYDVWLKSQGVSTGTQNYAESIELVLRYAAAHPEAGLIKPLKK